MDNKKISVEKIKATLAMISMSLLTIQHWVGILAKDISISYIPLVVTYLTIFINSYSDEKSKGIKITSLTGIIVIAFAGVIMYTLSNYEIRVNATVNGIYTKIMFGIIGVISLILSILYIKRMLSESEYDDVW